MRHRISLHKSLLKQLFPKVNMDSKPQFNVFSSKPAIKREENMGAMMKEIGLFPHTASSNRGIIN